MKLLVLLLSTVVLAVSACGPGEGPTEEPVLGTDEETTTPAETDEEATDGATEAGSLTGVLGGDAQLEGGCIWIEPTGGRDADLGDRVEPLLPDGWTFEFEPDLRILDAQGTVVAEGGDEVVIDGRPAEDMMTICQVGPAYQVDAITGAAAG